MKFGEVEKEIISKSKVLVGKAIELFRITIGNLSALKQQYVKLSEEKLSVVEGLRLSMEVVAEKN